MQRIRRRNTPDLIMRAIATSRPIAVITMAIALGGCASWQTVDKPQGAVGGAAGGAIAGALVGGPIGAVIGGIGGAFVGYETTGYEHTPATTASSTATTSPSPAQSASTQTALTSASRPEYDSETVRSVQRALNSRGYNAGAVNGQWNTTTQDAVRRFQQGSGIPGTGELNPTTLSALGVS
jgi:hypothetical protein